MPLGAETKREERLDQQIMLLNGVSRPETRPAGRKEPQSWFLHAAFAQEKRKGAGRAGPEMMFFLLRGPLLFAVPPVQSPSAKLSPRK